MVFRGGGYNSRAAISGARTVDIVRLIIDLYQEKKVPGIFANITIEF